MTPNKEDYLKCIYELTLQNRKFNNKLIAQVMQVSAPAVTEMLKKLISDGVIQKDTQFGFRLTQDGLLVVSDLIRKHRLIEVFLLQTLSYDYDQVHAEAEILEHEVSDYFIDKLDHFLNYPKRCPHGSVIPKKGEIIQEKSIALSSGQVGTMYSVHRFYNDERLATYLSGLNIKQGDSVRVLERDDYAQLVTLETDGKIIPMSFMIAQQIMVEPK